VFIGECEKHKWIIKRLIIKPDHVHLYVRVPNTTSPAWIAQILKGVSSRHLRQHIESLKGVEADAFWARRYFVISVGPADEKRVLAYLDNQDPKRTKPIEARL
jgi:putative transposase